jgi:EmrB/QacA subfamily drug resistance transporter
VTEAAGRQGRGLFVGVLIGVQFMVSLDATIVNVALPSVQQDLGMTPASLGWVVNAYALSFGGLLLLGARLGDTLGRRRVLVAGATVFALSSLWCGLAAGPGQLLAARAVQGCGAALMSPVAMAIVIATLDGRERHRVLGLWGAMSGLAGGLGMLAGGVLGLFSWRWNFLVNVPICAVLVPLALRRVPESRVARVGRPDVLGALLSATGLALLVFAVVRTREVGWGTPATLVPLALAAALLTAFVLWQRRAFDPIVPLRIFRLRTVSVGNAVTALTGGAGQVTYFFITLYAQQVLDFASLASGLVFLPISAAIFLTSTRASGLIQLMGLRHSLMAGLALSAVSLVWLARTPPDGSYAADLLIPSVLWGLGWGLAQAASFITPARGVDAELAGTASGLIATTYRVGGAACLAVMITIAAGRAGEGSTTVLPAPAMGHALLGGAVVCLLGLLLTALLPRDTDAPRATPVTRAATTMSDSRQP